MLKIWALSVAILCPHLSWGGIDKERQGSERQSWLLTLPECTGLAHSSPPLPPSRHSPLSPPPFCLLQASLLISLLFYSSSFQGDTGQVICTHVLCMLGSQLLPSAVL